MTVVKYKLTLSHFPIIDYEIWTDVRRTVAKREQYAYMQTDNSKQNQKR